ncbi:MAG: ABC transporter substrate-binding protein [Opitutae bacterium]|nr:ABC transporter substrate-binding protein [Opitutae bacterium]
MSLRVFLRIVPLSCLLLASASTRAAEPIKLGFFMSMTGRDASFGETSLRGAQMAIDELNAAGGVLGRPLELVVADNRSLAGESATAAKKLINRDKVVALIGECASSRSLEAAPVAQTAGVPMVSPASTNPRVTEAGDCIFRMCFADPFQGEVLASYAYRRLGLRRAALLVDNSAPYSAGLAAAFARTFTTLGGEVVARQQYTAGDKDFRAQLTTLRAAAPDLIFLPSYYVDIGLAAKQARELGITLPFLGGDGYEAPQFLEIGGPALNGTCYSTHFSPENSDPAVRAFIARHQARYQITPNGLSALTYDSVRLVADAIARAGSTDRAAVRAALAATRDFPGITGRTSIDARRDAVKEAAIMAVRDGRIVFVENIRP